MIIRIDSETPLESSATIQELAIAAGVSSRMLRYPDGSVVIGLEGSIDGPALDAHEVTRVVHSHRPYMLASNEHRDRTIVTVGDNAFGGPTPVVIAGPCVIEDRQHIIGAAIAAKSAGATMLRGGAFKPRTSPYAFQGLGSEGLEYLVDARRVTGMPVVTEVLEPEDVELVASYADVLQIGARNMANTPLLRRAGRSGKPVLLKRGFSASIDEWLLSAEYILSEGNPNVILCERGLRGTDSAFRFNLDLNAVPMIRELSHLPIIVDPSHGTGRRSLVPAMAIAGIAAGADGLILEAQPEPEQAKCDADQTIAPEVLAQIIRQVAAVSALLRPDSIGHSADAALEDLVA